LRPSRRVVVLGALSAATAFGLRPAHAQRAAHAIAMHGEPAWGPDFTHPTYANPQAPKGGHLTHGVLGTFDCLNPFIVKGLPAANMRGYIVESLLARGYDEPFTLYGLLAKSAETDAARTYVTFTLDPNARFSDGTPVTPDDVLFSWALLRDRGRLNYRTYYSKVTKAAAIGERSVRFDLPGDDRELPLILGLMPVLAKHAVDPDTFEETSMTPLLGSGPYRISHVDAGKSITLARNPDYWGRDLGVNRGFWNFDEVRVDYYRDANSYQEAFKKGLFDVRKEDDPARWTSGYDFPGVRDGRVLKEAFTSALPKPSINFVFNTRRAVFADIRVREALAVLFDFEWVNRSIFFGLYRRGGSFFEDSELSARTRPANDRERALLAPYPDAVRANVMDGTWQPPVTDGSGRDRTLLRRALELLSAAGYELRGTELLKKASGKPLSFEILTANRDEERLALLYAAQLKRAGISAQVRLVDAVQYEARRIGFDFDMIQARWDESLSPGNEQAFYWSSAAAESNGSRNYMGLKSPAADAMIAALLKAETREDVVAAVRALDRVLMSASFAVPLFYAPEQWLARWTTIARPETTSIHGYIPETWWKKPKAQ
jgi:peptide/nickel transport system substrate-binding protein